MRMATPPAIMPLYVMDDSNSLIVPGSSKGNELHFCMT